MAKLKTADEAKAEIAKTGLTIAKWSIKHGLQPNVVYAVLKGRLQGGYGDCHKAAVLLGMKEGSIENEELRHAYVMVKN